jgi:RNA polymerase primary sigma factor
MIASNASQEKRPYDLPRRTGEVDSFRQYLLDLGRYPRLSVQEEQVLGERIVSGDQAEEAKRRLILTNLRLVVRVAKPYASKAGAFDLLDLVQEGTLGLIHAADTFDIRRGWRFSTHATVCVRAAITKAIANRARTIRLPVQAQGRLRAIARLQHETADELPVEQIVQRLHFSQKRTRELLAAAAEIRSLEAMREAQRSDLDFQLPSEPASSAPSPDALAEATDLREQMLYLLAGLRPRERKVIVLRYGLEDGKGEQRSLEEIAALLGISREWARQLERAALRSLREVAQERNLQDYLIA